MQERPMLQLSTRQKLKPMYSFLKPLNYLLNYAGSSTRPERAEAPSPGQHPGYDIEMVLTPCKGKSFPTAAIYFKAFALTGRRATTQYYPGRCPGLGASALSGRAGSIWFLSISERA